MFLYSAIVASVIVAAIVVTITAVYRVTAQQQLVLLSLA
jgi:hypothetical protein